jgi:hypothetical protein
MPKVSTFSTVPVKPSQRPGLRGLRYCLLKEKANRKIN